MFGCPKNVKQCFAGSFIRANNISSLRCPCKDSYKIELLLLLSLDLSNLSYKINSAQRRPAPAKAFSLLKVPNTAFTIQNF